MRKIVIVNLILIVFLFSKQKTYFQWIESQSLQTTVLLGKIENNNFIIHGTGILLYNYDNPQEFIVVTCAHLIKGKDKISVRVKPDSTFLDILSSTGHENLIYENAIVINKTVRFISNLGEKDKYIHPDLDIAAFRLKIPPIFHNTDSSSTQIHMSRLRSVPKSGIDNRKKLSLGDEVYFIGFPLGIGATNSVEPIVRSGSIAWLPENENIFLLDALSYGGNSGSPIFRKIIIGAKPGQLEWSHLKLIGMVVGHQSIKLENMLNQPDPNILKFEKNDIDLNIGLARCVYTDDIMVTVNKLMEINK